MASSWLAPATLSGARASDRSHLAGPGEWGKLSQLVVAGVSADGTSNYGAQSGIDSTTALSVSTFVSTVQSR